MEGDYLELSQFSYNSHPFPYDSHQSPLGTTGFLTYNGEEGFNSPLFLISILEKKKYIYIYIYWKRYATFEVKYYVWGKTLLYLVYLYYNPAPPSNDSWLCP